MNNSIYEKSEYKRLQALNRERIMREEAQAKADYERLQAVMNQPYQDEYQSQDEIDLEDEIEAEEKAIIDDPSLSFLAVLEYLKSEDFSKDDEQTEILEELIRIALNATFEQRHQPIVSLVNAAIHWQATKNIGD